MDGMRRWIANRLNFFKFFFSRCCLWLHDKSYRYLLVRVSMKARVGSRLLSLTGVCRAMEREGDGQKLPSTRDNIVAVKQENSALSNR